MTNKETPDQYCYFTPGEFADELGNVYLALMAINDQILSVITASSGYYIMAAKPQIDPWCLFFVRKQ